MGNVDETTVLSAQVGYCQQPLIRPLVLSSGTINTATEARATVHVSVGGREAVGHGSIYLSDGWAWPDPSRPHAQRDAELRRICDTLAGNLADFCGGEAAHPLELGMRLHQSACHGAAFDGCPAPILARAMCASPFDAAIHDAAGQALAFSAFAFYRDHQPIPSADKVFPDGGACAAIAAMLRLQPRRTFPAWVIVGKDDDLQRDIAPWVKSRGYRCFKIKILGKDNDYDMQRTLEVYRAARDWGISDPWITVDSNEANPDSDSVLDYLCRLRETDAGAFAALKYLEQPTGRDIRLHRYDWRAVHALKPVFLDEGLTELDLLEESRKQGWSGLALKTCKGHSFALVCAAWAHRRGIPLSLQDLTNPGRAAIHAALFAAYVPTINGVELNSPQFTPAANAPWLPRLSPLLEPMDGMHRLDDASPPGLGSAL